MSRQVATWIGKTDDSAIPDRVRDRLFVKHDGRCALCSRELRAGHWQADHVVPLILGGSHAETNLQPLCTSPCHAGKTRLDVKLKAKVARVRKKHIGIKKASRFPGSRDSRFKKKVNGEVVLR